MAGIIILLVVIVISLVAVKIGTVALRMTGLDEDTASFQALSAFSNTGFTTREAEQIVSYPRRRRIAKVLMITGKAVLAAVVAALSLAFTIQRQAQIQQLFISIIVLLASGALIYKLAVAKRLNRYLDSMIAERMGGVRYLGLPDFHEILTLAKGYGIASVDVAPESPLVGHTLDQLRLGQRGVLVLAIHRGNELVSSPGSTTTIHANDRLVCYGDIKIIKEIAAEQEEAVEESEGK